MATPLLRGATYQDLAQVPETRVAEILDGDLYASPRPAPRHALASSRLGAELTPPFDRGRGGPGGWLILDEPELHLGHDVVVPDLAGWRRARMSTLPDTAWFETPPDWLCEVLSPSTARLDRVGKLPAYARSGIPHIWLLDPLARTLEVYRLDRGFWVLVGSHGGDARVRAEPFEAFELELDALWADEPPPGE